MPDITIFAVVIMQAADSIFKLYQAKYPEDMFGWYMGAKSKEGIDSTGANGLAQTLL